MAGIFACKKSDDTNPSSNGTVTVTIGQATISETSITVPVVVSGNATIVQRGVCWDSIQTTPTISNHKKADPGTTAGSFSVLIDQLTTATTYYVRGYVTTNSGTVYSDARVYTTISAQLTIGGINNITDTSASINASLIYSGALQVGARGFCWGTQASPTIISVNHDTIGSGAGLFSATIKGLQSFTKYYVRAYAIIGGNVIYSADSILTTTNRIYPRDVDGNTYDTVKIGTQVWMKQNLKTTKYRNGTLIPIVDALNWQGSTTGACLDYNIYAANVAVFGNMYNWYTVANAAGLCPQDWHVPSDGEWNRLVMYLDPGADTTCVACNQSLVAGSALLATDPNDPNLNSTNSSGFTGLLNGHYYNGLFEYQGPGGICYQWTSTEKTTSSDAFYRALYSNLSVFHYYYPKNTLQPVRCLRD